MQYEVLQPVFGLYNEKFRQIASSVQINKCKSPSPNSVFGKDLLVYIKKKKKLERKYGHFQQFEQLNWAEVGS